MMKLMIIALMLVLGLCFGSFVNALTWRLHEQSKAKKGKKKDPNMSMMQGRSMCVHCKHPLAAKDLIPVFSWLSLGGKCRYCHKPIDDNPLTEVLLPIAFLLSYIYWPLGFKGEGLVLFLFWLVFLVGFAALMVYDFRWGLLPNTIVYKLIALAAVQLLVITLFYHGGSSALIAAFWGVVVIAGLFYALFQLSGGKWIGGGDVKLGVILGLLVGGPAQALLLIFIASSLGTLVALPLLITKKLKPTSRMPFGPFLLIAGFIVYLWGFTIISWYRRQVGLV